MGYKLDVKVFKRVCSENGNSVPSNEVIDMFKMIVDYCSRTYQYGLENSPFRIPHGIPITSTDDGIYELDECEFINLYSTRNGKAPLEDIVKFWGGIVDYCYTYYQLGLAQQPFNSELLGVPVSKYTSHKPTRMSTQDIQDYLIEQCLKREELRKISKNSPLLGLR